MFTDILTHKHGRILVVSLNRSSNLNAWNDRMYKEWGLILDRAAVDDTIACVVLRGNGKAFSAGQDVAELADYPIGATGAPSFDAMLRSHITFPKPLIAAVHGIAIGWGATLLAHCDLVIMSASSRIRVPFTALGLIKHVTEELLTPVVLKQTEELTMYLIHGGPHEVTWKFKAALPSWIAADATSGTLEGGETKKIKLTRERLLK